MFSFPLVVYHIFLDSRCLAFSETKGFGDKFIYYKYVSIVIF
ncbi:hypothetical protein MITS9504_00364 [Synechococcus sp. MIT S9504]|nr:hypothetical protein MITS9504_00364 [Synechococcus sp. MIT S9504]